MSSPAIELLASDTTLFLHSKKLAIRDKRVETPRRALSITPKSNCEARMIRSMQVRGINEIYHTFDKEKLNRMYYNNGEQKRLISSLNNEVSKASHNGEINLFIFNYDTRTKDEKERGERHTESPEDKEIEYLCDMLMSPYNDAIIPPLMPYLTGEQYLNFLRGFFETLPSYRSNVVTGTIPADLHRSEYPAIIDFYDKKDIRFFLIDLHGGTPESHYVDINFVLRRLTNIERDSNEICYLHGLNVKYGKPLQKTPVAPAKDIMSFYLGIDSFGTSHLGPKYPEGIREKFLQTPRPSRLYNRADYGYYRTDITFITTFPKEEDMVYQIEDFYVGQTRLSDMAKIFNAERHGIEARYLRSELTQNKTLRDYIKSKKQIEQSPDLLKDVLSLKEDIVSQRRLF